ncbi:hypothetical protein B0H14DRAFT_2567250 [Mycena olivaceomarginata]|nr:hypothetical protein B0H14DRAFT_2567250 [Mycena olivaceomarginata]
MWSYITYCALVDPQSVVSFIGLSSSRNFTSSGRVALFNITGFVTDCCLTVNGIQSSRAGPQCSMQSITVTGLNDTVFRDAINAANIVSDFMLGAGPHITLLPSIVTLGGLCRGITAMAQVMIPAEHNIFEVGDIPAQLDVEGYAKNWVNDGDGNQRFVYTLDNDIKVMNLLHTSRAFIVLMKKPQLFVVQKVGTVVSCLESDHCLHRLLVQISLRWMLTSSAVMFRTLG